MRTMATFIPVALVTVLVSSIAFNVAVVAMDVEMRDSYQHGWMALPPVAFFGLLIWCSVSVHAKPKAVRGMLLFLAAIFLLMTSFLFIPVIR